MTDTKTYSAGKDACAPDENENTKDMNKDTGQKKVPYVPPRLEFFHYKVESGFQDSAVSTNTTADHFSEINDYGDGSNGGENQTGQWDDTPW